MLWRWITTANNFKKFKIKVSPFGGVFYVNLIIFLECVVQKLEDNETKSGKNLNRYSFSDGIKVSLRINIKSLRGEF